MSESEDVFSERDKCRMSLMGVARAALILSAVSVLSVGVCAAKETMQETLDRILAHYSRICNPNLAEAQRVGRMEGTCGPRPDPNRVEAQVYVHRLGEVCESGWAESESMARVIDGTL